ncbi:MAG: complex I subunit 4 family protein [Flavobacteriales bacterium]
MLTIALIAIPLIMSGVIFLAGANLSKTLALATTLIQLALTGFAAWQFSQGQLELLTFDQGWIGPLGIHYHFTLDGISLILALLSAIVSPLIVYSTFGKSIKNPHIYYSLIMMMIAAMMGAFTAADGLWFYIFYEIALIPIYFIVLNWGHGEHRAAITLKFFVYTIFGSLFMLASLLYVYQHTAPHSFAFSALYEAGKSLSGVEQGLVFAGFFIAFAVKMPVFPFHTWQPSTYNAAPTAGTMLLAAIMLKMATYGLIRIALPMVPTGVAEYGTWAMVLSVMGIVYASGVAIAQKKYKLLIAYSSIAHVGLISAGILSGNSQGVQGGLFEMLSHGILAVGLFYVYDILESRFGHDDMAKMGGIRDVNPLFAFLFFAIVMGSVALPFTSGFVGEFLLLVGLFQYGWVFALFGGLTVILGAVYMLRAFQTMMLGPANERSVSFAPLTTQEKTILAIIVILVIALGIFPAPLMELSNSTVESILATIH